MTSGPWADSLPWFDFPLVQDASRLRYTDKAQTQRPGDMPQMALAQKKKTPPGPGRESDVVHRLRLKCSDRAILVERRSQQKTKSQKSSCSKTCLRCLDGFRGVLKGSETVPFFWKKNRFESYGADLLFSHIRRLQRHPVMVLGVSEWFETVFFFKLRNGCMIFLTNPDRLWSSSQASAEHGRWRKETCNHAKARKRPNSKDWCSFVKRVNWNPCTSFHPF